jgi:hypothetical protein
MKQKKTAAELLAELSGDADYLQRKKRLDEEFLSRYQEEISAEEPLLKELRASGVQVRSVWDLVNEPNRYPQSFQILLTHLQKPYPDSIRDGIARALAVPGARFAWPTLVRLYREEGINTRTKQGIAVALSNIADDEVLDDLITMAGDSQLGVSRVLLLDAIGRSQLAQAELALVEFANDSLLQKEARRILDQLKDRS